MASVTIASNLTIGVLALQGAFREHLMVLRQAAGKLATKRDWSFIEVRAASELESCDALIIPGGESTAISLIAQRTNLLEPLRKFVKVLKKPTWGTCAGMILLAEATNGSKEGGQELVGGLDILVNRNHFGRQTESFEAELDLSFLGERDDKDSSLPLKPVAPFRAMFIRAPIVEHILHPNSDALSVKSLSDNTTTAIKPCAITREPVEVLARLPAPGTQIGAIVAVKQENIFGTSFHPELTGDIRIHIWWLEQVLLMIDQRSLYNRRRPADGL
ncbi:putative pyridoxal 5'-phosphate synthase subunit PDX2 [Erysiphe neolycopersici]|uniref:glutaminase n=1 Tax=Erysiphe neolycopersici TaxID=212602 RepID=A0A420HVY6_9PEZI|nr:putative pyridoxal 5'-phosphate synthase subunit PDX2 [Erysiphe neolycopersici]